MLIGFGTKRVNLRWPSLPCGDGEQRQHSIDYIIIVKILTFPLTIFNTWIVQPILIREKLASEMKIMAGFNQLVYLLVSIILCLHCDKKRQVSLVQTERNIVIHRRK